MITTEVTHILTFILGMVTWAVIMDGPHRDKRRKTDHRAQKPQVQQLQRAPNCQGHDDNGECLAVQYSDQTECSCDNTEPEPLPFSSYCGVNVIPVRFAENLQNGERNPNTSRILTCPHGKQFDADLYEVGELCPCNFEPPEVVRVNEQAGEVLTCPHGKEFSADEYCVGELCPCPDRSNAVIFAQPEKGVICRGSNTAGFCLADYFYSKMTCPHPDPTFALGKRCSSGVVDYSEEPPFTNYEEVKEKFRAKHSGVGDFGPSSFTWDLLKKLFKGGKQ